MTGRECAYTGPSYQIEMWAVPTAGAPTAIETFDPGRVQSRGFDPQRRRLYLTGDDGNMTGQEVFL